MDNEVLSSVPSESACGSSAESMSPLASFPSPGAAAAEPIAEVFARASSEFHITTEYRLTSQYHTSSYPTKL